MIRRRCQSFQPLLVDYADDALSETGPRQRLERHLARCSRCRDDLAALRQMPVQLQTQPVPEPGEEFWLQQRRAIARAVRNLPAPRRGWWAGWVRDTRLLAAWRYPLAAAVSLLVAFGVYHFTQSSRPQRQTAAPEAIAQLDAPSIAAVHDLMRTLVPSDDDLSEAPADDDSLLAALPLDAFVNVTVTPQVPQTDDLSSSELEGLGGLVGNFS